MIYAFKPFVVLLVFALSSSTALAQQSEKATAPGVKAEESVADILRTEQAAEAIYELKREQGFEPGFARTPLEAIIGLGEAFDKSDLTEAALYLDLRYLPEDVAAIPPTKLAEGLVFMWSLQNIVDLGSISDAPEGNLDDGLASYRDQIGSIALSDEVVPFYLQRIPDGKGGKVWRVSNETIARGPEMWSELGYSRAAIWAGQNLPQFRVLGMRNWQFTALVIALVVGWLVAILITRLLAWISLKFPSQMEQGIRRFWRVPARFVIYILLLKWVISKLGLSVTARVYLESSGLDYLAVTVLISGLITLFRDYKIRNLERKGDIQFIALLRPLTLIIKLVLFLVAALMWANQAGFNVSAILAGLGVGSLAVALAAQKTLENVIGAITLYSARPVKPGDLCRFGTTVGLVEEIGLRSVSLRTLDRSVVSIPNSVFSSMEVENLSSRDRIRYFKQLPIQMPTSPQLRVILGELRAVFLAHPRVIPSTVSIRLETIEAATAVLRIDAGIDTRDYQDYLAVAEDLNLRTIETVQGNGAIFSGPGQVLQVRDFHLASEEELAAVEEKLERWEAEEQLPFPDWSAAEKERIKSSLTYPPKGSPSGSETS